MENEDVIKALGKFADDIKRHVEEKNEETKNELRSHIRKNQEISLHNHEMIRRDMYSLKATVNLLWKHVHGTDKEPPTMSAPERWDDTSDKAIVEQVSEHNLELASLQGQVIALSAATNENTSKLEKVLELNQKQSESMGIGLSLFRSFGETVKWMIKTKEGQKFFFSAMAGVTSLITAAGTTYALITGRLPSPLSSSPPAMVQPAHGQEPANP